MAEDVQYGFEGYEDLLDHPLLPFDFVQSSRFTRCTTIVDPIDWVRPPHQFKAADWMTPEFVRNAHSLVPGYDPSQLPRKLKYDKHYKSKESAFGFADLIKSVSKELKDLIEELEPGIHQFVPYDVVGGQNGSKILDERFCFLIRQVATAVDLEKSDIKNSRAPRIIQLSVRPQIRFIIRQR